MPMPAMLLPASPASPAFLEVAAAPPLLPAGEVTMFDLGASVARALPPLIWLGAESHALLLVAGAGDSEPELSVSSGELLEPVAEASADI